MVDDYEVRGVLAGAYRGKQLERATVRHVLFDGADRTACGRVREEHLCDVAEREPPTCAACLAKLKKRLAI